jgi:nucleoside phosphorylase
VGLVDAAVGAARAIAEVKPSAVVFMGTAGLYPGKGAEPAVAQAVAIGKIALLSHATLRSQGYFPGPMCVSVQTSARLRRALARAAALPTADLACPLSITRSALAGRRAARATGCALENLEAFAVARASAAARLPFAAVVGISNDVGPHAHRQWLAAAEAAAAAAGAAIATWLAGVRPPSPRPTGRGSG